MAQRSESLTPPDAFADVPACVAAVGGAHFVDIGDGCLAATGHPRLAEPAGVTAANDAVAAVARALAYGGAAALGDVLGDFALAFWDRRRKRGILAADRIGVRPLVYATAGNWLAFASSLDALRAYPGVDDALDEQSIYDYLHFHVCPLPRTIYRGMRRLPPGHWLAFGEGIAAEPQCYWRMQWREDERPPLPDLEPRFRNTVEEAVRTAAGGDVAVGAFLSGGTDSSTVSGMLGRVSGRAARTFSIGFDAAGYDEMVYARIAARHFGCEQHEYYVTPDDVVAAVPRIASHYDQPFGNASAIPTYYCAQFAREHGVQRLLAGDGGDELFGGNERYAKQQILGFYHRLPGALRRGFIEPATRSVPLFGLPLLRKLRSYVEQASPDMPARYESYNLLNYLGADNLLSADFLASIDRRHPQALVTDAHSPFAGSALINQLQGIDLRFTLADSDLPKVTRMCELAGIDVAFPLLDERVVDFAARLAPEHKLRGTQLRWFFKHALRDFLPPEIISKQKQGFGLPVGAWLVGHRPLFDLAAEAVHSLRAMGLLQPQFTDELLGPRLREHPKYFGTMVWVLMMLGLWLQARRR